MQLSLCFLGLSLTIAQKRRPPYLSPPPPPSDAPTPTFPSHTPQPGYTFTVKVAMLEIYNEEVRDLLSPSDSSSSASGNGIGIAGGSAAGDGGADGGKLEIRRDQDGMVQVRASRVTPSHNKHVKLRLVFTR